MNFKISSLLVFPTRLKIAIVLFMSCFMTYMLRANLSILLIAMMQEDRAIGWSNNDRSVILGAYFYGYLLTNLFASVIVQKFSSKDIIGLSLFFSGMITGLSVTAVQDSIGPFFMARFLLGCLAGFIYPSAQDLISRWSPPEEKGKFVFTLLGGNFGTVATWSLIGPVIESLDWRCALYITGIIAIIFSVIWFYVVSDSPMDHPGISSSERDFIQNSLGNSISKTHDHQLPVIEIFKSVPFYSLLVLHFGNLFGLYFLIVATPRFMAEVLHFNLSNVGWLSGIPHLMRIFFGFIFGWIVDYQRRNNLMKVTAIRKFYCIFSHIIPGLLLIGLCFVGFSVHACIAIITLSLGFNGAATVTSLQNSQDLAPNFAGPLFAIINFIGTTSGFISPMLVAYFVEGNDPLNEWKSVFYAGAAFYILPALIFIFFGSGDIQQWNDPQIQKSVDTKA